MYGEGAFASVVEAAAHLLPGPARSDGKWLRSASLQGCHEIDIDVEGSARQLRLTTTGHQSDEQPVATLGAIVGSAALQFGRYVRVACNVLDRDKADAILVEPTLSLVTTAD